MDNGGGWISEDDPGCPECYGLDGRWDLARALNAAIAAARKAEAEEGAPATIDPKVTQREGDKPPSL